MDNCTNCENSIFDELWGEYKCKVLQHRMHILLDSSECKFYKKDLSKKGEVKLNADYH